MRTFEEYISLIAGLIFVAMVSLGLSAYWTGVWAIVMYAVSVTAFFGVMAYGYAALAPFMVSRSYVAVLASLALLSSEGREFGEELSALIARRFGNAQFPEQVEESVVELQEQEMVVQETVAERFFEKTSKGWDMKSVDGKDHVEISQAQFPLLVLMVAEFVKGNPTFSKTALEQHGYRRQNPDQNALMDDVFALMVEEQLAASLGVNRPYKLTSDGYMFFGLSASGDDQLQPNYDSQNRS